MAYSKAATIHTSQTTGVTVFTWKKEKPSAQQCALDLDNCKPTAPTRDDFYITADKVLGCMAMEFWFSEFRTAVPCNPPSEKVWGCYTRHMSSMGYYRTSERRRSPVKSRKGSDEAKWCRAAYHN